MCEQVRLLFFFAMGTLHTLPNRKNDAAEVDGRAPHEDEPYLNLSVWKHAPRERTSDYFPVYSSVARALQATMRGWVREWFYTNPAILHNFHASYTLLVYFCSHPYSGRPANTFTYDVQSSVLQQAYGSAAANAKAELEKLDTRTLPWYIREKYFPYSGRDLVAYVKKHNRDVSRMFNADTVMMNALLKFALIDIPRLEFEKATIILRRNFNVQLRRFSSECDLSGRADELLCIVTDALVRRLLEEEPSIPTVIKVA